MSRANVIKVNANGEIYRFYEDGNCTISEALEGFDNKDEYIEERRIAFNDLEMLCYQNDWGRKAGGNELKGFIYIVSTRKYLATEDIVKIAERIKGWSDDESPLIDYANKIGALVKSHIYIVPKEFKDDD